MSFGPGDTTLERVLALARADFLGASGIEYFEELGWVPVDVPEEKSVVRPSRMSADEIQANIDKRNKKRKRRPKKEWEELGERGVASIETMPGGGLVSGKSEDEIQFFDYELLDLKADNYTKPELRERIKNRIMAGSRGGKPGQWSARKAQLLAMEYRKAGGGYKGGKRKNQRSLDKWTSEKWTTSDGKPAIRKGGTTRYLPKKAWANLTPAEREATNRKKREGSRLGRQFISNTANASRAGRQARQEKSAWAPIDGDADVFTDIASARRRARQIGCIGVARRSSRGGNTVWTPCSNMTDYQKRTGSTAFGRRRRTERELRILRERVSRLIRNGKSLSEELHGKAAGTGIRAARRLGQTFDPNALDGDNDGIVQDGTAFQRPATPGFSSINEGMRKIDQRRSRKIEKAKRTKPRKSPTERAVESMTDEERDWFSQVNQEPEISPQELDAQYLSWLSKNPAYVSDLDPKEREALPFSIQQGFASSVVKGQRLAVGSGGREMSKKILGRVRPEHTNKTGKRKFHFVGGTPGSGKSSLVEKGILNLPGNDEAAHIDPDEIKKGLAGYDGGKGAQVVHSASRIATDKTMSAANDAGMDIVVQGVGKRTEHLRQARAWGMETAGHFVYVPGDEADRRIAEREKSGGTSLPKGYGSHMMSYIRNEVPRQITSDLYDEFYLWDNSGREPRIIASRLKDGTFVINDDDAFDDFFGRSGAGYVRAHWNNQ